jgi:hypothetical protein
MVKAVLCVLAGLALYLPLGWRLYHSQPVSSAERSQVARLFVAPEECRPEPGERRAFLAFLAVVPAGIFGTAAVLARWTRPGRLLAPLESCWVVDLVCGSLLAALGCYCLVDYRFFHIYHSLFFQHPLASLPLFLSTLAALTWPWQGRRVRRAAQALAFALVAAVCVACVFDENGAYCRNWHFTAVFQSVVQVHFGKALLVDCHGQYGLYAHFLQPLFAVLGLTVPGFTAVMAALLGVSYASVWQVLRRTVRNQLVALVGFFALVFTSWFYLRFSKDGRFSWVDFYFQYHPIRFLFPALLVFLGWRYFRRPGPGLYGGTGALLAAGVLWNFDSGVPALAAWLGGLCYSDLLRMPWRGAVRRAAGHAAAVALCLAGVVALYAAAIHLRYGAWPDFAQSFRYQRLFYIAGFFMLPMQLPGTWVLVLFVYLSGLAYAAAALFRPGPTGLAARSRPANCRAQAAAGSGGDSAAWEVEERPFLPRAVLACLGAGAARHTGAVDVRDSFFPSVQPEPLAPVAVRAARAAFTPRGRRYGPGPLLRRPFRLPGAGEPAPRALSGPAADGGRPALKARMVFLLSLLGLGLFSYYQGRSHPYVLTLVWWPCFFLLALFLDDVVAALRAGSRRLLHGFAAVVATWFLANYGWSAVVDLECVKNLVAEQFPRPDGATSGLRQEAGRLREHASADGGVLVVAPSESALHLLAGAPPLTPCSYIEMVLVEDHDDLLRRLEERPEVKVYVEKEFFTRGWKTLGNRRVLDALEEAYELCEETEAGFLFRRADLLLSDGARPLRHLAFGDGRCPPNMQAPSVWLDRAFSLEFVLRPEDTDSPHRIILSNHCGSERHQGLVILERRPNVYDLEFGDGRMWVRTLSMEVPPDRWSYLTVTVEGSRIRVFRNGRLVGERAMPELAAFRCGSGPVFVGNWIGTDWPFRGQIREVRILDHALAPAEVAATYERIQERLD